MHRHIIFSTVSHLDLDTGEDRWNRWRPLIELLRMNDFKVDKLCFFISYKYEHLVPSMIADMLHLSPDTEIVPTITPLDGVLTYEDIGPAYTTFNTYFASYPFDLAHESYYFHLGPGNLFPHALMLIMLFHFKRLPFQLLRLAPNTDSEHGIVMEIYEGDIRKWIATISESEQQNITSLRLLKSSIETRNTHFNRIIEEIEYVATQSVAPILLSGPTGSGKSHLARKIYELRYTRGLVSGTFVEINCATLRGESVLSNLFGHVRGSFTGANAIRQGLLRSADQGVLFLDEIAEIPMEIQSILLKAIEEKQFYPFGSDTPAHSDFQLLCGTNRDLMEEVRRGRFRLDLLSRINMWQFHLPALRDRLEDISPNIDYELERHTKKKGFVADFLPKARERYLAFAMSPEALWLGNFRDLSSSIERMQTYAFSGIIDEKLVEQEIARLRNMWRDMPVPGSEWIDPLSSAPYSAPPFGRSSASVNALPPRSACPADQPDQMGSVDQGTPLLASLTSPEILEGIDLFDRMQLEHTLRICCTSSSRSEAGRRLFGVSRQHKSRTDDTTRLNKYLKSFGLDWEGITALRHAR